MRYCLLIVSLCMCLLSSAQQKMGNFPVFTLRTNPFSFAEVDAGAMLGVGVQWNPRWAVNIDPMYIFYSPYYTGANNSSDNFVNRGDKIRGIKLRGELRYYFRDYLYGKRGWFGAIEFHYKKVTARRWDDFGMNCVNGQCDFYQFAPYNEVKKEQGVAVKMGWLCRLWNQRWAAEFYTGVGIKFKQTVAKNQPLGATFLSSPVDNADFTFDNGGPYPMFPCGIKLIYRIF